METTDDTEEVCAAIRSGTVNLASAMDAIREVIRSSEAVVEWQIDCTQIPAMVDNGVTLVFSQDDLTLGEQMTVVDKTGVGWGEFSPQNDQRHAHAVLASRAGIAQDAADDVVKAVTTGQFDAAHRVVEKRPASPTSPVAG